MQTRRRVKQTESLQERLAAFSKEVREEANGLPPDSRKDDAIRRARQAETAAHIEDWLNSPGLQQPK